MPEKSKQDIEEPEVEDVENPDDKSPDPAGKTEKTYTEEQVNRMVQARLRKEKESSKSTIDALSADVTFYEGHMEAVVAAQTADWDEGMKLLFNALPVRERLEKLGDEDFMAKVRRKNVPPITPKNDNQQHVGEQLPVGGRMRVKV